MMMKKYLVKILNLFKNNKRKFTLSTPYFDISFKKPVTHIEIIAEGGGGGGCGIDNKEANNEKRLD